MTKKKQQTTNPFGDFGKRAPHGLPSANQLVAQDERARERVIQEAIRIEPYLNLSATLSATSTKNTTAREKLAHMLRAMADEIERGMNDGHWILDNREARYAVSVTAEGDDY